MGGGIISMARILVHPSLDSPKAVEGTCDQRRLIRLPDGQSSLVTQALL